MHVRFGFDERFLFLIKDHNILWTIILYLLLPCTLYFIRRFIITQYNISFSKAKKKKVKSINNVSFLLFISHAEWKCNNMAWHCLINNWAKMLIKLSPSAPSLSPIFKCQPFPYANPTARKVTYLDKIGTKQNILQKLLYNSNIITQKHYTKCNK